MRAVTRKAFHRRVLRALLNGWELESRGGAEALAAVSRTSESQWRRLLEDAVRLARRAW